ncbi:elongation factor P maturation arginine rhamnosyltransferase EarP [Uliginosibacterium sediminicola]|uniref:Protein-arginine rhamnosyltransferase n=1 Tax=Uliginosibacterium sediminicola TaxID=2024550 RepID=A0ABU9Z2A9_9RHOO
MTKSALHVDIFCTVIDNFGDAGVCWRLARQLALEHGCRVRLWIDQPVVLHALVPELRGRREWQGVALGDWQEAAAAVPAQLVIEAFACNPPASYVQAMQACNPPPQWINLEYLSAEDWVEGCHGLPSPQPGGLRKYFFFPGFTPQTGGLLREQALDAERRAFQADALAQAAFWRSLRLNPSAAALKVSLFAYENAALPSLLAAWANGDQPVFCAVPLGRSLPAVAQWVGLSSLHAGDVLQHGALSIAVLPFLAQSDYDRLLWACDLNFVRGEDSFVRAQWAQRPFVWHIYQQQEAAHRPKLEAFLQRSEGGLPAAAAQARRDFWRAWDDQAGAAEHWPALRAALPELGQHAAKWAECVADQGDLASKLLIFCRHLLE